MAARQSTPEDFKKSAEYAKYIPPEPGPGVITTGTVHISPYFGPTTAGTDLDTAYENWLAQNPTVDDAVTAPTTGALPGATSPTVGGAVTDPTTGASPDAASPTGGLDLSTFLGEGAQVPAGSAVVAKQTQTVLPEWYTNYAMDILANQKAEAARGYQKAPMPSVAEFSPTQVQGFDMTKTAATAYEPALTAATGITANLAGQTSLGAAQPYFSQAMGVNPSGAASADLNAARTATTTAGGLSAINAAQPYLNKAAGVTTAGTVRPFINRSMDLTQQGTRALGMQAAEPSLSAAERLSSVGAASPTFQQALATGMQGTQALGLETAQPFLEQAGQNATDVSAYMDPYVQNIVRQVGDIGERNLRENLLPALTSKYITAGQLGFTPRGGLNAPSGLMTDTARALRDIQEATLKQQGQLLSQGYQQAQSAAQADLARKAQLASTAGQLGTQQQQALLEAAQQQATIGTQLGNLTQAQQDALARIGATRGQLGTEQQQALLEAAKQTGTLGEVSAAAAEKDRQAQMDLASKYGALTQAEQANKLAVADRMQSLGTTAAGLSENDRKFLADLGINVGGMTAKDVDQQLALARQLGALGASAQELGLTGASAVTGVGTAEQQQAQRNLDAARADWLAQHGYNQDQIDKALVALKGVSGAVPSATQTIGIEPNTTPQTSTADTIAGSLTGVAAILDAVKGL